MSKKKMEVPKEEIAIEIVALKTGTCPTLIGSSALTYELGKDDALELH